MLCQHKLLQPDASMEYRQQQQHKKFKNLSIPCQYCIKPFTKNYQQIKEIENQSTTPTRAGKKYHRIAKQKDKLKNNKKFYKFLKQESHHAAYSPYYHTPLLTSSPYTTLDAGVAAYHHGGFVSPLYGSHLSHVSPHISPYVASSSPYIGGHHYGLHPYDSLFLRH
ncbi:hypothetical protein FF38_01441 [Lucilia cuprina]|uniref:Uncharacterized protein n=1 Tax=Lucilia cuprina TaxID=7375 RepID=A0A0L0BXT0_LUCCU|nr:hypothetical protein FF38_01441 [Lucilia cuprina]